MHPSTHLRLEFDGTEVKVGDTGDELRIQTIFSLSLSMTVERQNHAGSRVDEQMPVGERRTFQPVRSESLVLLDRL